MRSPMNATLFFDVTIKSSNSNSIHFTEMESRRRLKLALSVLSLRPSVCSVVSDFSMRCHTKCDISWFDILFILHLLARLAARAKPDKICTFERMTSDSSSMNTRYANIYRIIRPPSSSQKSERAFANRSILDLHVSSNQKNKTSRLCNLICLFVKQKHWNI